jgi:uncharacterized membrane protein YfcA
VNENGEQPKAAIAIAIACVAALLSTMLGIGGGIVMVPLLTLFARMPIKRTAGTSLAVIFLVIVVGVIAQEIKQPGDIHWDVSLVLAAGALIGSFIGEWLNKKLPERVFRYILCAVLVLVGVRLVGLTPETSAFLGAHADLRNPLDIAYLSAIGLLAGIVSALFGLGGGIIAVPALALAYIFFQEHFTATRATSLGMILPTSLVGAFLHWKAGNVDLKLVGRMAPFALAFAVAGVLLAYAVPADILKVIFGVLLVLAAVRLALKKRDQKS